MSLRFYDAVNVITQELKENPSLYYAYQSNIAMAFQDEFLRRYPKFKYLAINTIANNAAKNFMNLWIKERKEYE